MNENIDLTKILKDCPKGWKFWSPLLGEVEFERNYGNKCSINISVTKNGTEWYFTSDAKIMVADIASQEIMIYPSRYLLDWSKFNAPWYKKDKFDPKTLKPFDKVICQKGINNWRIDFFSSYHVDYEFPYACIGGSYLRCIPYNEETKHLLKTKGEAPEYYRYWEDRVMKQEDKELLLRDLCARVPYVIKASYYGEEEECETWDEIDCVTLDGYVGIGQYRLPIERIKPYLFPLSGMTKEQKIEIFKGTPLEIDEDGDTAVKDVFYAYGQYTYLKSYLKVLERLNKNHFDYRGLIEKGLAIDATGLNIY